MPGGVATVAQFDPPSVVRARAPATWSSATAWWPVTQQRWSPMQEMPLAPDMAAGRAPVCTQDAPEVVDTSATEPVAADSDGHAPTVRETGDGGQVEDGGGCGDLGPLRCRRRRW